MHTITGKVTLLFLFCPHFRRVWLEAEEFNPKGKQSTTHGSKSSRIDHLLALLDPEAIKKSCSLKSAEHDFFLLIYVKMPTIFGILPFMNRKNSIQCLSGPEKNLNYLTFLYLQAFKISCSAENCFNPGAWSQPIYGQRPIKGPMKTVHQIGQSIKRRLLNSSYLHK